MLVLPHELMEDTRKKGSVSANDSLLATSDVSTSAAAVMLLRIVCGITDAMRMSLQFDKKLRAGR